MADYTKAVEGARQWLFLLQQMNSMKLPEMLQEAVSLAAGLEGELAGKQQEKNRVSAEVEHKGQMLSEILKGITDGTKALEAVQSELGVYQKKLADAEKAYNDFLARLPR